MKKIITGIIIGLLIGVLIGVLLPKNGVHEMNKGVNMAHDHTEATHEHPAHGMKEIDTTLPIPSLTFDLFRDETSGYNVQIKTKNFIFTPERINTEYVANEGHAHIYVNDIKVARVYGEWFHLDGKYLRTGKNVIRVSLNGNNHSELLQEGVFINAQKEIFE